MRPSRERLTRERFDAVLFDLDGVLTDTSTLHALSWKRVFDDYLATRAARTGEPLHPFDLDSDYRRYLNGRLRCEGARGFLASRGIRLPEGEPASPAGEETVCGLANLKNDRIVEEIAGGGVRVFDGSIRLLRHVRRAGFRTAVVTASHNCEAVLGAAGIEDQFDARVDGNLADRLGLPGKPAPDTYLRAASELGVGPPRAAVIEDSLSGVQAGRAGGFGLVIGVDRTGHAGALSDGGAHLVVGDLDELL